MRIIFHNPDQKKIELERPQISFIEAEVFYRAPPVAPEREYLAVDKLLKLARPSILGTNAIAPDEAVAQYGDLAASLCFRQLEHLSIFVFERKPSEIDEPRAVYALVGLGRGTGGK